MSSDNYCRVDILLEKNSLGVSSSNEGIEGDVHDEMEIDYEGEECQLSFDVKTMMSAISLINDKEFSLVVRPTDVKSPISLRNLSGSYLCMIMPLAY